LDVANPPEFTDHRFLQVGRGFAVERVAAANWSKRKAHVQEITLEGPEFT